MIRQLSFIEPAAPQDTLLEIATKLGFTLGPRWHDYFGEATYIWSQSAIARPIRTLSLFSGAGGLDIGFHDAGFSVQKMIEIDKRFAATLRENSSPGKCFDGTEIICGDIRDYKPSEGQVVDFIIGGPPCQTFSAAGRRAAGVLGTDDNRGMLFEEYVRLLKVLTPQGFLFENVYGMTGAENGEAWERIQAAFAAAGYRVFFRILDAADYGVPQHRERLFIVGTKDVGIKDILYRFPLPTHGPDSPSGHAYFTAAEAIAGVALADTERMAKVNGRYGDLLVDIPPGLNYSFYTQKLGHPRPVFAWRSKFSDFLYKADPDTPVRTIKAQGGQYTGPFHWENRPFSVDEMKRLQTIPDSYLLVGGRQAAIQQIGNSVPPQLARVLALSILNQLFGIDLLFNLPLLEHNQSLGFRKRKRLLTETYERKATEALQTLVQQSVKPLPKTREYTAVLADDFGWSEQTSPDQLPNLRVEFTARDTEWRFVVSRSLDDLEHGFMICLTPRPGVSWGLGVERVVLLGSALEPQIFTGVWKAFEWELIRLGIKADLVQLCGYYQYQPSFRVVMSLNNSEPVSKLWKVVQVVSEGMGVRATLPVAELAALWHVSERDVLECARFLKSVGYEVRNENTNPLLPEGHLLVPYVFPTLNPLSVQLRKSLEGSNG